MNTNNNISERYANWLMNHRWWVLLTTIAIVLFLASGARFLKFDNDYRIFFDDSNPQLQAFEHLQNTYTKNDSVIMALAPKDGKVFKKETLAAVIDITEQAWKTPFSTRVDSLSNFQHTYAEGDDLTVADLIENPDTLTQVDLDKIQEIALNEPLIIHRLLSDKSHVTAINITVELPEKDVTEIPETVASVRELTRYINDTYPQLDVYLSGIVMMNNAFPEAAQYDMSHLIPMALLIILSLVFFLLRVVVGTLVTLVVIIFSVLSAMGTAGWLGIHLSPPAMSAPIIILTLAVADCVHILTNWLQGMRRGLDNTMAMKESLRINFGPVFLTSITTAIGFMSLNFSDAPPFRDLGNISAMGVLAAWILSVAFMPALVTLLPSSIKAKKESASLHGMDKLADFVVRQQKKLLVGMGLLFIVLVAFIPRNELNDVFVEYFDERIQFRTDTDFLLNNLTGIYFVDFSLESNKTDSVSNPEYLKQVKQFSDWLETQPEVIHVNTFTNIMTRLNRNMHGDDDNWRTLPKQQNLAAQYLLLYEMSLPYGLDLNNQVDINKRSTRLSITLETISTQQLLALEQRIHQWMENNTQDIKTLGTGPAIMFAHIGMKNIVSLLTGAVIALILISFVLVLALRSWRYGLISLIPNLMPAGLAFGLWAVVDGEIGLGLSVVSSMTIGIVVDDTVHFLSKYLRAKREQGLNAEEAVRYAFSTVGSALWVTSVALVGGFLVISTSSFSLNSDMGLVTAFVVAFALLADFLFLPPLLIKFDSWLSKEEKVKTKIVTA